MSIDSDIQNNSVLDDKKSILITLCSNFLSNKIDELYIESSFSNTDLLFLLDDVMTSLYNLIVGQLKQLVSDVENTSKFKSCLGREITELKFSWDKGLERIANKIVRSQMNEKTVFQTFNQIDKFQKSTISSSIHSLKRCVE